MRSRDYIITYSGKHFTPLAPDADAIDIKDIAHALARIGRANGHFVDFYSVGQHCLDCACEAMARGYSARQSLACLLHDASEAYMSDITSPVKKHLRQYMATEDRLLDTIYHKYLPGGVRPKEQRILKELDNAMLYHEFRHFMGETLAEKEPELLSEPCFGFTSFQSVEEQYLYFFQYLTSQMQEEEEEIEKQTVGIVPGKIHWIAVVLDAQGGHLVEANQIDEICSKYKEADAILTNIPIGLPENKEDFACRPESQIQKSSLEIQLPIVPCRQAIYAETETGARKINQKVVGYTLSSTALLQRKWIREIDEFLQKQTEWKNVLRQSQPQLLGEEKAIVFEKYNHLITTAAEKHAVEDALCLAMIGQLETHQATQRIPENPEIDAKGIQMQIISPKRGN